MRQGKAYLIAAVIAFGLLGACGGDDSSGGTAGAGGVAAGAGGGVAGGGVAGATAGATAGGGAPAAPNCATYCSLAAGANDKFCTGTTALYPDLAACNAACPMITTLGTTADTAGNTLGCRIYHLTVANMSVTMAMTHCAHGKVVSDVCK